MSQTYLELFLAISVVYGKAAMKAGVAQSGDGKVV